MSQHQQLTAVVDEAIAHFRGRELVTTAEITDVLLDLRLLLLELDSLEEMMREPATTASSTT
jgi:hypothetical protein